MPSHSNRFLAAAGPLLVASLTGALAAQTQPLAENQPAPVYESATVMRATTRMVVVDVVATDRSGNPVTDLKPGDFTVLENGSPQQVRSFNFQRPS